MNTVKYWVAGAAALVVLVAAAGWFLLISPRYSHAGDLRSQAQEQEDANATLTTKIKRLQQDEAKLPEQQALLATVQQRIPTDAQLPGLTRQLVKAAAAVKVDLVSISPDTAQLLAVPTPTATPTPKATATAAPAPAPQPAAAPSGPDLYGMHVQVVVNGGYFNVQQFVGQLERLDRTVVVTGLDVGPGEPPAAESNGGGSATSDDNKWKTLDATIDLTVFMSPTSPIAAPTGATAPSNQVNS